LPGLLDTFAIRGIIVPNDEAERPFFYARTWWEFFLRAEPRGGLIR